MSFPEKTQSNGLPSAVRDASGRLKSGAVLNPGGRPKGLAKAVREMVPEGDLVRFFNEVRLNPKAPMRERLEAAKWLADRGYGRVVETQVQIQAELGDPEASAILGSDALAEFLTLLEPTKVIDVTPTVVSLPAGDHEGAEPMGSAQPSDNTEETG